MCYSALIKREIKYLKNKFGPLDVRIQEDFLFDHEMGSSVRVFPGLQAPVVGKSENGFFVDNMQYGCFQPEYIKVKYTTFNARRDNLLSDFWDSAFMLNHGCVVLDGFSEWVAVTDLLSTKLVTLDQIIAVFDKQTEERRQSIFAKGKPYKPTKTELLNPLERKVVIDFTSQTSEPLYVPVIFNQKNNAKGFAIVTHDPLPEVFAAGHDRSPIFLDFNSICEWMSCHHKTARNFDAILARSQNIKFEPRLLKMSVQ